MNTIHISSRIRPAILSLLLSCGIAACGAGTPGLAGGARVSVSTGVILLTPGRPLPTRDLAALGVTIESLPTPAKTTPTTAPTVDIASVTLPFDLSLYPGATDVDASNANTANATTGMIVFHSKDSPYRIIAFYNDFLKQNGWKAVGLPTPPADAAAAPKDFVVIWMKTGNVITLTLETDSSGKTIANLAWTAVQL